MRVFCKSGNANASSKGAVNNKAVKWKEKKKKKELTAE